MHRLRKYQIEMLSYGLKTVNPKLFVQMRLGKTLVTIRTIKTYEKQDYVLIIAPYSAVSAWRKELLSEGITEWIELFGSMPKKERKKELKGWVLCNKEIYRTVPEIRKISWDVRVLDESTFIKEIRSRITKFYVDPSWKITHDWRLTGTPDPNSKLDYYTQTKDLWVESNFYIWRNNWFKLMGYTWVLKTAKVKEFHQILARGCFYLSRKDASVGGEKVKEVRNLHFPKSIQEKYDKLVDSFILENDNGLQWETMFAGAQYSWLMRLCGGAMPNDQGDLIRFWDGKIQEILNILQNELAKDQVVIWAHFTEEVESISKKLKVPFIHGGTTPKQREKIKEDFRLKKFQWLVAQPACLAHSTDFSFCDTAIYYSSPRSTEIRAQSEERIISVAKDTPSLIIDLVIVGTIDEVILRCHEERWTNSEFTKNLAQFLLKSRNKLRPKNV